jgi:thioredoxin-like negative regulator of GroEL
VSKAVQAEEAAKPCQARRRQAESAANDVALSLAAGTDKTVDVDRVEAVLETDHTSKRDSAYAGRWHLHVLKAGKNAVDIYHLNALETGMGRAAA